MLNSYDILGSIIFVDNIIFCNKNGTKQVDHSIKGRPCIIIAELDEYYFCPITSHVAPERLNHYPEIYYKILTDILEIDYHCFDNDNLYKIESNLKYQKKKIEEKYSLLN